MNKREAKLFAIRITSDLLNQEVNSPSEIANMYAIDDDDLEKVYKELDLIARSVDERITRFGE